MGIENIEKKSFLYAILKKLITLFHNHIYYRSVITINGDNVPKDERIIFAPNHQNALMDAMAVLCTQPGQPVFLARSDIFKNKNIARLLTFFKILPIYRIRDGYSSLKNNEKIFNKTIDVLENKNGLVILPEGNHAPFRRLRILKKGIARLAFQAAEKNHFSEEIKIIPVGIDYSDYYKFRQQLTVSYGEPIPLSAYYDLYQENPTKAIISLVKELGEGIKQQMIHIENQDHYETINTLRTHFEDRIANRLRKNLKAPWERIESQQEFISLLNEFIYRDRNTMENIEKEVQGYVERMQRYRLRSWVLNKRKMTVAGFVWRLVVILLLFPLFLYGLVNNWLPYKIPVWVSGKLKDKVFVSSFKFVLSFVLFPLFHFIQAILVYLFSHDIEVTIFYFISLPLTGTFAFQYYIAFKKFRARWRYSWLSKHHHPEITRLEHLHHRIGKFIDRILN